MRIRSAQGKADMHVAGRQYSCQVFRHIMATQGNGHCWTVLTGAISWSLHVMHHVLRNCSDMPQNGNLQNADRPRHARCGITSCPLQVPELRHVRTVSQYDPLSSSAFLQPATPCSMTSPCCRQSWKVIRSQTSVSKTSAIRGATVGH